MSRQHKRRLAQNTNGIVGTAVRCVQLEFTGVLAHLQPRGDAGLRLMGRKTTSWAESADRVNARVNKHLQERRLP